MPHVFSEEHKFYCIRERAALLRTETPITSASVLRLSVFLGKAEQSASSLKPLMKRVSRSCYDQGLYVRETFTEGKDIHSRR